MIFKISCPYCETVNGISEDFELGTVICAECEREIGEIVASADVDDEGNISARKVFVIDLQAHDITSEEEIKASLDVN